MDSGLTRASLLSRLRDPADAAAWREFECRYRELVLQYCRVKGLQRADAEDVCQVVFVNLAKALRGFEYAPERGRFRDYLGRAVRNSIGRVLACPNVTIRALDSSVMAVVPDEDESDRDAAWDTEWVNHHYRRAMQALATEVEPKTIHVFERLVAGETVDRVAAEFGMNAAAVHKIKQRVRDRLREIVAEQVREEDEPDESIGG